ncbi:acyl-CoA synthetase [Halopenitus sp. H-Gu1]|uniref:acyl-CoA synthetase n=1 Tax=Halopenitus sp. H-Gu1 TaxID=3242697 RepID=UPI00359E0B07
MSGAWIGYDLPTSPASYHELCDGFEWERPETYNIADVALGGDPDAIALRHVPEPGRPAADGVSGDEIDSIRTLTYGALADATATVATRLREAGIGPDDRVAVCLPQCPELVVLHLAVLRLGGVVVPVSMLLGDESFAHVLEHSDTRALFVDEQRWNRSDSDPLEAPDLTVPVRIDEGRDALGGLAGFVSDTSAPAEPPMARTAPEDPALVLYTSGTTSDPKGVIQSHQYLLGSMPGYHCWFELFDPERTRQSRVWTPSEWAWAGALFDVVFPTLAVGGTVVSSVRRAGFDAANALERLCTQAVTHAFLPPTALRQIRRHTDPSASDVTSLRVVMCGGESLPPSVAEWAESTLDVTVNESYGQTEANALVGESDCVYSGSPDALGRPYPGHEIVLLGDDGQPVSDGEIGEITVTLPDPVVMRGYLDDKRATDAVLDNERLRTGDLGRFKANDVLEHLGRKDDLILSSGYRISPLEIENALMDHPDVAAVLVEGESDEERGQRAVATVVPATDVSDEDTLSRSLRSHVAERLGPHKRPRRIEFVSRLSTTRTDKTDRSENAGDP